MFRTIRLILTIVFITASAQAAEQPSIRWNAMTCQADDGTKVDCESGELRVSENRANPSSRMITLRFFRFKSTAEKPGAPIVYLAGGPGGSGINAARGPRFPLFMAMRAFGDVIALDQRGVGKSEPNLECHDDYIIDPSQPASAEAAAKAIGAPLRKCFDGLRAKGIDLDAYNTLESAHDLDDLRKALGVPKISLWAISYGTHLALATVKAHEAGIDRLILAGIEGPDSTLKLPSDQQELLEKIAVLAKTEMPDLLGTLAAVEKKLEKPRHVDLTHPISGQKVALTIGKSDLQIVVADMLTGPESFNALPDLLSRLAEGDWMALALAAGRLRFGRTPSAMAVMMDCASGATPARATWIAREAATTLLADAINWPYPEVCRAVGAHDLGDAFRTPVKTTLPVLLIAGTLDGRTPVHNAVDVAKGMPNATLLTVEGAGHSDPLFLSSPKILDAMKDFMATGKTAITRACAASPKFIVPRHVVVLAEEALKPFAGDYRAPDGVLRTVSLAGSVLYITRKESTPFALRPSGSTEFFYEGAPFAIRFERDGEGKVVALTFIRDGAPPVRSEKVR
ncbi:MAG: hypothetical protein QOC81_4321 [Thermoanaerobaculia bacterium]|jgi:pimeloyl-ACP methyl ester carboxylesterase|nr:hypothetical protein [Thermoanaerobaculia bacterium]